MLLFSLLLLVAVDADVTVAAIAAVAAVAAVVLVCFAIRSLHSSLRNVLSHDNYALKKNSK